VSGAQSLYSDVTASRVGDLVTVLIVESTQASQKASTQTKKDLSLSLDGTSTGSPSLLGNFGASGKAGTGFRGEGTVKQSGKLLGSITVSVVEVLPNGNLRIEGSKEVGVNKEQEILTISGVIRPQDLASDNSILSTYVSEARINYSGKGPVDAGQRQGVVFRLLNWLF
jgi:flagellar L-ring protein precursor FlgH